MTRLAIPRSIAAGAIGIIVAGVNLAAQTIPAVRPLGRLERVSTDSLASVTSAMPLADGRVMVNDTRARRVLLLDSTLSRARVVIDTTSATANAYGRGPGTLIRYREDSALFIDRSSLSMFVLTPTGAIARVMAIPRPDDSPGLIRGVYGTPFVDARGRLVYFAGEPPDGIMMVGRGAIISGGSAPLPSEIPQRVDSGFVFRVDLATRAIDTVASLQTGKLRRSIKLDPRGLVLSLETTPVPVALVDDWALLPDGTIAVVRGRDYHVDWLGLDGRWSSSPKVAFDWQRIADERKQTLIDSAVTALRDRLERAATGAGGSGSSGGGGRGGSGSPGGATGPVEMIPSLVKPPSVSDLVDYWPAFDAGAVYPDADGNLWVRTTTAGQGQSVYDVLDRRGERVDRVQLPSFRTIAGFGKGVVYLAMKDSSGAVHLERARVK